MAMIPGTSIPIPRKPYTRKMPPPPLPSHDEAGIPFNDLPLRINRKLTFLVEKMCRYKVAYGGRGSGKSWAFADALISLGANQKLRILCCREVQKSIDESVMFLLKKRIKELGLSQFYDTSHGQRIKGRNGTEFIFAGLSDMTVESLKSYEDIDICWVEEAQTVTEASWKILTPTIRADNSEIWVSFNPKLDDDPTWKRFVQKRPTDCIVVEMNWRDNKHFNSVLEQERQDCLRDDPDNYDNIWEGKPLIVMPGSVYAREIVEMAKQFRLRPLPYDPRFPVHRIWDLGWNDSMAIIMVQKITPSIINVINYLEDDHKRYDQLVGDMKDLGYLWGNDWLPHDGFHGNPQTGTTPAGTLEGLGCAVREIPKTNPENRIRMARQLLPRVYIDDTDMGRDSGYLGGARLIQCLKRYKRAVPKGTNEPASPVHDQYSHGADAFGGLAEIAEQIKNDGYRWEDAPDLPDFENPNTGMGSLG